MSFKNQEGILDRAKATAKKLEITLDQSLLILLIEGQERGNLASTLGAGISAFNSISELSRKKRIRLVDTDKEGKVYRVLLDPNKRGHAEGIDYVSERGAEIMWNARIRIFGASKETMDEREKMGGILWLSEIKHFIKRGELPKNFNHEDYLVEVDKE